MAGTTLDPRKIELLDDAMVVVLRSKTPAERLAMAFDCNRTARLVIAGHCARCIPIGRKHKFRRAWPGECSMELDPPGCEFR